MEMVMTGVATMPPSRGRRGYADQASSIRDDLKTNGGPMLVCTDRSRNGLETLSRHLRDFDDVETVVAIHAKDETGAPASYALYARIK